MNRTYDPPHAIAIANDVDLLIFGAGHQNKRGTIINVGVQNGHTAGRHRALAAEQPDDVSKFAERTAHALSLTGVLASPVTADMIADAIMRALDHVELDAQDSPKPEQEPADLLDMAPDSIHRPLCIVADISYAVAWVHTSQTEQACVIVRTDGQLFTDARVKGARPITELGLTVPFNTDHQPSDTHLWSGAGIKRYRDGYRADAAGIFDRMVDVSTHFLDFNRSLADATTMLRFVAVYTMATWFLDAFSAFGYLWATGEKGSGKTNLLIVITELGYLGRVILQGGTYPTLRDEADWGATLGFDEAENIMDVRKTDPDKRALVLAGYRRGATIPFKEPNGSRGWRTRHVHAFCARQFAAIRRPDPTLSSRCIILPMVRSTRKITDDPSNHQAWPHDRRALIDDLWALGLANLPALRAYDRKAAEQTQLIGRDLEPWRPILAVALWLQENHGVDGIYDDMLALSGSYQDERADLETDHTTRLAMRALLNIADRQVTVIIRFKTKELADEINRLARADELGKDDEDFTTVNKVGWQLKNLRLEKDDAQYARGWKIARTELVALAAAYGVRPTNVGNPGVANKTSATSETSKTSTNSPASRQNAAKQDVSDVLDDQDVLKPSIENDGFPDELLEGEL